MKETNIFKLLTPINWVMLLLATVVATASLFGELSDSYTFYKSYFPLYWGVFILLINIGIIPALYSMGITKEAFRYQVWYGVIMITFYLVAAFYSLHKLSPETNGPYMLVISVFSAATVALGWVIHVQISSKSHRKSHTLNLLMQSRLSGEYQSQLRAFTTCFPYTVPFTKEHLHYVRTPEKYSKSKGSDDNEHRIYMDAIAGIRYVLNYFEFLSVGISKDDLDEELLYDCLSGIIINNYDNCSVLINYWQEMDEDTYCNLDKLVASWKLRAAKEKETKKL